MTEGDGDSASAVTQVASTAAAPPAEKPREAVPVPAPLVPPDGKMRVEAWAAYSGPLPPPKMLEGYNYAFPGCAERIVAMAERQAAHRQLIEKTTLEAEIAAGRRIHWMVGGLCFTAIVAGAILLGLDKKVEGFGVILTGVAAVLGTLGTAWIKGKIEKKDQDAKPPLPPSPQQPANQGGRKKKRRR